MKESMVMKPMSVACNQCDDDDVVVVVVDDDDDDDE